MRATVLVAMVLIGATSCRGCSPAAPAPAPSPSAAPSESAPKPSTPKSVVEGSVRLAEGFALPSYRAEGMEKKVLDHVSGAALPGSCTPFEPSDRQPVKLTSGGHLAGIMLAASKFSHQPRRPPRVHDVVIRNCRLEPALVVAMKGDTLRVRNEVDYPFMPGLGQQPVARTLARGQTQDQVLDTAGVNTLLCGFTAPCGRTDVIVMLHPYYAVTDATGRFRFDEFPTGEPVSLNVWHPLFQESKQDLRVEPGAHQDLEFTLTPIAQPIETPQPDRGEPTPSRPPRKGG
jgi:hypothetical protein